MNASMDGGAADRADPPRTAGRVLSRRSVLISAGAIALAGAGGIAAATVAPLRERAVPAPPASLVAARDAEDALIAGIDASAGAAQPNGTTRALLAGLRADHVEHRRVLTRMIGAAVGSSYAPTPSAPTPSAPGSSLRARTAPRDRATLRAAERDAARAGAARAATLHGEQAALLASIAACEASHADLLA